MQSSYVRVIAIEIAVSGFPATFNDIIIHPHNRCVHNVTALLTLVPVEVFHIIHFL